MLTLPFQILTKLCFNENELMQKLNRNLTKEENFSQITTEDENELAEREVFFYKDMLRKDGNDFYTDTVSGFQNTPALH